MHTLTHQLRYSFALTAIASALILSGCGTNQPKEHIIQAKAKDSEVETIEVESIELEESSSAKSSVEVSTNVANKAQDKAQANQINQVAYAEVAQFKAMPITAARVKRVAMPIAPVPPVVTNNETYQHLKENTVQQVSQNPLSTFSIDVDTGSYTNSRRMLNQGQLPPSDAIRPEEFINYFNYQYPAPKNTQQPFSVNTQVAVSPWNSQRHLVQIGLQGFKPDMQNKKANLVFLVDVSGSMNSPDKLGLLKKSLTLLTNQLSAQDKVAIVVYAGASGVVLEPTAGNNKAKISHALNQLSAGGSTNGAAGIELAYQLAEQSYIKNGVNRVILATDGDFNVGTVNHQQLIDLIKREKEKGIALTTLGFGQGNYNDHLMEQLADAGNGNYAYIDTLNEARKVLVDELQSTMQIIAKDVKIQVEFNPQQVAEYRLLGYENRKLNNEDFKNDKVDAGDIGAGHSVTAFYEITLTESKDKFVQPLRYLPVGKSPEGKSPTEKQQNNPNHNELALVKLRYKQPNGNTSKLISQPITREQITAFNKQSNNFKFATAVVSFAQLLKQSTQLSNWHYHDVLALANANKGQDNFGYRGEFVQLVRTAQALQPTTSKQQ